MALNGITRIRKEVGNLCSLEVIDLSSNQIISDEWSKDLYSRMARLRRIELSHNHILSFPNFFFCESIAHIDLSYNELEEVENNDLAGLNHLQYLNLSHNAISRLTNSIVFIKSLREIDVSFNKIRQIEGEDAASSNLTIWPEITRVNLENNEFSEVPACLLNSERMGNLENLACINIKSNNVQKLPNELQGLKRLREFNCANNNVKQLSLELHSFMKNKIVDINLNELKLQPTDELTPVKKRLIMSKRDSRNFDKLIK
jgi:Leucine-rich repeat (LRR) protein